MTVSKITGWMFNPSPSSTFTPTATTSKRGLPASYFTSCQSTILQGVPQQKGACLSTTPHVIHFVSTQLTGTLFFRGCVSLRMLLASGSTSPKLGISARILSKERGACSAQALPLQPIPGEGLPGEA
eukprot:scaffold155476_cov15-Tisochrysis_lutea.AAC.1